jgi:branched-chain amino acid transport system ATP-binding protein
MLDIREVTKHFGGFTAVHRVDMTVSEGEIHALIGPNGAGKTTLFNLISGTLPVSNGEMMFRDKRMTAMKPDQRTELGLGRTFQNIRLIKSLTVHENVMLGCHCRSHAGMWAPFFSNPFARSSEEEQIARHAEEHLRFVGLEHRSDFRPQNLPYGEQRRLEIARALATGPSLLLLDEPAAGMNPQETQELNALIRKMVKLGITILLIEHDMKMVMNIAHRITVISYGKKIAEGTPQEIRANRDVIEAYLGEED